MPVRTVFVSGAYGYLGGVLRARLDQAGWETVALVRKPRPGDRAERWTLGGPLPADVLRGADALVHCAWDFGPRDEQELWRVNVEGSALLLRAAAAAGVDRILALSSMSAYTGTRQLYGRAKLALEQEAIGLGGVAVRPGLVYGPAPAGMAGALLAVTRLPIVPVIGGDALQFPVHQDDLAEAVVKVLDAQQWTPEVFGIAQPEPLMFRDLLRALAGLEGRRCRFVPVPWQVVQAALRLAELLHIPLPLRSDSLLGLVRPAPSVPPSAALPKLLDDLRVLRTRR